MLVHIRRGRPAIPGIAKMAPRRASWISCKTLCPVAIADGDSCVLALLWASSSSLFFFELCTYTHVVLKRARWSMRSVWHSPSVLRGICFRARRKLRKLHLALWTHMSLTDQISGSRFLCAGISRTCDPTRRLLFFFYYDIPIAKFGPPNEYSIFLLPCTYEQNHD